MQAPNYGKAPVPPHVPAARVVDFNYLHPPGLEEGDVYSAWHRLHVDTPDIFWTPWNGGHWVFTRAADMKWVQETYQIFSHEVFSIPRGSSIIRMPPLTVDPPLHARYRALLNPSFTPARIREISVKIRELTLDLIAALKPQGGCEFVNEFARIMPVTIFLGIVDLPIERRDEFVGWATGFISADNQADRDANLNKGLAFMAAALNERAQNPGEDLLSRIAGWRKNPRYAGEEEVIGMAMLVFFGGLDTVANMLSFTVKYLAGHPQLRQRLRDDPAIVPRAAEEFIRRFGLSNTGRLVTTDTEYRGVLFKKDDMVMVSNTLASMDEQAFADPLTVDFDRVAQSHNSFGNGPHKCVGAPLARAELQIFLQEWVKHIPDFEIDPERPPVTHSGNVNGVNSLHLLWNN